MRWRDKQVCRNVSAARKRSDGYFQTAPLIIFLLNIHKVIFYLILISIFGLGIRCFLLMQGHTLSRDSIQYVQEAKQWHRDGALKVNPESWRPPLFIYLIKNLMRGNISAENAGLAINLVFGVLLIPVIFLLTKLLINNNLVALGAASLAAVHPSLVEFSCEIQRDCLYLFLCGLFCCFLLLGAQKKHWYYWCLGGITLALAAFCRMEALEFFVILIIYGICFICGKKLTIPAFIGQFLWLFCTYLAVSVGLFYNIGKGWQFLELYWMQISKYFTG